ncbi:hypothetical protein HDU97_000537 [Phlyctochytrium planicorne]|nr:hypothetical protein HDU97_000537 [Phlyctochytrium planicorne]
MSSSQQQQPPLESSTQKEEAWPSSASSTLERSSKKSKRTSLSMKLGKSSSQSPVRTKSVRSLASDPPTNASSANTPSASPVPSPFSSSDRPSRPGREASSEAIKEGGGGGGNRHLHQHSHEKPFSEMLAEGLSANAAAIQPTATVAAASVPSSISRKKKTSQSTSSAKGMSAPTPKVEASTQQQQHLQLNPPQQAQQPPLSPAISSASPITSTSNDIRKKRDEKTSQLLLEAGIMPSPILSSNDLPSPRSPNVALSRKDTARSEPVQRKKSKRNAEVGTASPAPGATGALGDLVIVNGDGQENGSASPMSLGRRSTKGGGSGDDDESVIAASEAASTATAMTWLKATKEKVMPKKAKFPSPLPVTEAEALSLRAQGRALPPEGHGQIGVLGRVLGRMELGPRLPPKSDLKEEEIKFDVANATPESVYAAMKKEEELSKKIRKRRCLVRTCIGIVVAFLVISVIMIPVLLKVIIPWMVKDSFANGNLGDFIVSEVSFLDYTEVGATANFTGYLNNVNVPLNIPVSLSNGSKWTMETYIPDQNSTERKWVDMLRVNEYTGDVVVLNKKMSTSAKGFSVEVLEGGWPLAAFVEGLSRLFAVKAGEVVPLMALNIEGLVNVGTLKYEGLQLRRVFDLGRSFTANDLTRPGPGPMPAITAQDFTLNEGKIKTGLRIILDDSQPTPLGFHFRNIGFNLTLDGRSLAYCMIPELLFESGSTTLNIPLEFFSYAPPKNSSATSTSAPGSAPTPNTQSITDNIQVVLQGFDYQNSKLIGATNVTIKDAKGKDVPWLTLVASRINFEYPLSELKGASGSVVATWILGIVLRSLGITGS